MAEEKAKRPIYPEALTHDELAAIVSKVRDILCAVEEEDGSIYLDPDKEVGGGDCVDRLFDIFHVHGLLPTEKTPLRGAAGKPSGLACPHCGYDGKGTAKGNSKASFRVVEDVEVLWPVVSADGKTISADPDGKETIDESYKNTRIECCNCLAEFAVPEGMTVSWD